MVLKEDKEFAISGKQQGSVREETSAVSGTMKITVQNRHQEKLHLLNHQHKEVEVRREKKSLRGRSPTEKVRSTTVQRLLERYLHQITL